ncbi:hypothetical protein O3P69_013048 [Scylla paramamosain]|uniref:Uncharacterized protein n=1 Tax=Scylla paramamosain TaxID=85552 RepID=A0AAW0TRS2_SCYPA
MERAICNEKFLKEEPDKLESALRRCKKLTGTLVTLKRLASVQEQRVPPLGPGGVPVGVANGDPRATSPTPTEDLRASSSKAHHLTVSLTSQPRPLSHTASLPWVWAARQAQQCHGQCASSLGSGKAVSQGCVSLRRPPGADLLLLGTHTVMTHSSVHPVPGPGRLVRCGTWGPRVPLCPLRESGRGLQTPKGIRQCLEYRHHSVTSTRQNAVASNPGGCQSCYVTAAVTKTAGMKTTLDSLVQQLSGPMQLLNAVWF